jgi:hypothetical protein
MQSIQFQKDKQVNLLLNKIDLQEEAVRKTNRAMSEKMKKLQNALEDRMATMNAMQSKLSIAEGENSSTACFTKCNGVSLNLV